MMVVRRCDLIAIEAHLRPVWVPVVNPIYEVACYFTRIILHNASEASPSPHLRLRLEHRIARVDRDDARVHQMRLICYMVHFARHIFTVLIHAIHEGSEN